MHRQRPVYEIILLSLSVMCYSSKYGYELIYLDEKYRISTTPRKRRGMVVSDRYGLYRGFNTSVIQQYGRIKNRPLG
jgi:hypothetical protein